MHWDGSCWHQTSHLEGGARFQWSKTCPWREGFAFNGVFIGKDWASSDCPTVWWSRFSAALKQISNVCQLEVDYFWWGVAYIEGSREWDSDATLWLNVSHLSDAFMMDWGHPGFLSLSPSADLRKECHWSKSVWWTRSEPCEPYGQIHWQESSLKKSSNNQSTPWSRPSSKTFKHPHGPGYSSCEFLLWPGAMTFSGGVKLGDLDDFISLSQEQSMFDVFSREQRQKGSSGWGVSGCFGGGFDCFQFCACVDVWWRLAYSLFQYWFWSQGLLVIYHQQKRGCTATFCFRSSLLCLSKTTDFCFCWNYLERERPQPSHSPCFFVFELLEFPIHAKPWERLQFRAGMRKTVDSGPRKGMGKDDVWWQGLWSRLLLCPR